jgi:hypothetical protein
MWISTGEMPDPLGRQPIASNQEAAIIFLFSAIFVSRADFVKSGASENIGLIVAIFSPACRFAVNRPTPKNAR